MDQVLSRNMFISCAHVVKGPPD